MVELVRPTRKRATSPPSSRAGAGPCPRLGHPRWDRVRPVPLRRLGIDRAPRTSSPRTSWDPVSKQPQFKVAAVPRAQAPAGRRFRSTSTENRRIGTGRRGRLTCTSPITSRSCIDHRRLGDAFRTVAHGHAEEHNIHAICEKLAAQCDRHAEQLRPFAERYGEDATGEPGRLHREIFGSPARGTARPAPRPPRPLSHGLRVRHRVDTGRPGRGGSAIANRGGPRMPKETATQIKWARSRMKEAAPQALVVAS